MADGSILRLVYVFFVGVLVAIFVGVGISTFYPAPKEPEFPSALNTYGKEPQLTAQQIEIQNKYDAQMKIHQEKVKVYSRNVSIVSLVVAVVLLVVSLVYENRIRLLADGLLLGGLFTLFYSLIRGFISEDTKYVFVVVTLGLATVLYLGYRRFVRPREHKPIPAAVQS